MSTPYYRATCRRQPVFVLDRKPLQLAHLAVVTERQRQNYRNFLKRASPIVEGQRYADCLARDGVSTKAQVAEMFGVSRPRVTQCTNLLKLPAAVVAFLMEHDDDPIIRNYFSERRLRPLTFMKSSEEILRSFKEMVDEARKAPGVWTGKKGGEAGEAQKIG